MKNYQFINNVVQKSVEEFITENQEINLLQQEPNPKDELTKHFCYAKPTKYDVIINGQKIAGAAQRRKQNAFLHQGSISMFTPDFDFVEEALIEGSKIVSEMKKHTAALFPKHLEEAKQEMRDHLQKNFTQL